MTGSLTCTAGACRLARRSPCRAREDEEQIRKALTSPLDITVEAQL